MKTVNDPGCPFVVRWTPTKLHCNKIPDENSVYCPHHYAYVTHFGEEPRQEEERRLLGEGKHGKTGKKPVQMDSDKRRGKTTRAIR